MGKVVAFLAECQGSPTIDQQRASMRPEAYIVVAGRQSLNKLGDLVARSGGRLEAGDRVLVYDLSCITLSTSTLIRIIGRMLRAGIAFEIVSVGIAIEPALDDKLYGLIQALAGHQRHLHGLKTHPETASRGRKPLLNPQNIADISAKLKRPGATATGVARELGVARSTLFNFLDRYDPARSSGRKKIGEGGAKNVGEGAHLPEGNAT